MTTEEKSKAYDAAINRAKAILKVADNRQESLGYVSTIFPELVESEDELTWLTKYIEEEAYSLSMDIRDNEDRIKLKKLQKALAWLEKQDEQKPILDFKASNWYVSKVDGKIHDMTYNPTDRVEPKFHEGDWVVNKFGDSWHIDSFDKKNYQVSDGKGNYNYFPISKQNEMHLWTIQDAKDGDVLISQYGNPLIYNGNYNSFNIGAYCGITCDDNRFKVAEEKCHWTENVDIEPSTKEQRDLLFQKMKEAGYEWDSEKKELKKINSYCQENCKGYQETGKCFADGGCDAYHKAEQKSVESPRDYHDIDPHFGISVEELMSKKNSADKVEPIFSIGDVLCDKSCTTLNKKYQPIIEILDIRNGMYICNNCSFPISQQDEYELVTKKNEPQYAWSDEDESIAESIEGALEGYEGMVSEDWEKEKDWLKSLKNKMQPQIKEWSDEDDYNLQCIIDKVNYDIQKGNVGRNNELIDWLKSIKDRATWKPSEEQMEIFKELIDDNSQRFFYPIIKSLYNDLKKLKEK